ncbi:MAG: hypothetical protein QM831_33175 [Kofleriaceae bacterium]
MKTLIMITALASVASAETKATIVVCSPGSPGTTDEAQPTMDAFAATVSDATGANLVAVYDPSDEGGAKRLTNASIGIVSLPFFLEHEQDLGLHARLVAVQKGRPALDRWSLVAKKSRAGNPAALAKFTIVGNTAFAPAFVRGVVLAEFGKLPSDVTLKQSTAVLSALRHAADGDNTAIIVDGAQEASLAQLPYAKDLDVVARSEAFPAGLVVTVDRRINNTQWKVIEKALLAMPADKLDMVRMSQFTPVDDKLIDKARRAYTSAP